MLRGILLIIFLLFLVPRSLFAEIDMPRVRVINDEEKGVKSEVTKTDRENKEYRLGLTDDEGYKEIDVECKSGEVICVKPQNPNYYRGKCECPISTQQIIKVTRKEYLANLQINALYFESSGNYGKAAMIYNEIYFRAIDADPEIARVAEKKVYVLFGKILNNYRPITYDPLQGKTVMSEGLKWDIKEFQKNNNIKATGNLNYRTLSKAANSSINYYIFRRVDISR